MAHMTNRRIRDIAKDAPLTGLWRVGDNAVVVQIELEQGWLHGLSIVGHGVACCHPKDRDKWSDETAIRIAEGRARGDLVRRLRALFVHNVPIHLGENPKATWAMIMFLRGDEETP